MKNYLLCLLSLILLSISLTTKAQVFITKAGFNLSSTKYPAGINNMGKSKMKPGFHIGGAVEFPLDKHFSIETGIMLNNRGSTFRYINDYGYYSTNYYYLDVPVVGKFYFPVGNKRFFGTLGPYIGFALIGWAEGTGMPSGRINWDPANGLRRFEMGATSGFGLEIKRMQCGIFYDMALTDLVSIGPENWSKNRVLRFSVGYRFGKTRS